MLMACLAAHLARRKPVKIVKTLVTLFAPKLWLLSVQVSPCDMLIRRCVENRPFY